MKRRNSFYIGIVLLVVGACVGSGAQSQPNPATELSSKWTGESLGAPLLRDPIFVYNNWSSYDELSDNISLTEELAIKELRELLRLRGLGVHFDFYMMDAFWFAPDGAYRTWRKPDWPNGPDRWIDECRRNGILPGLWFGTNQLVKMNPAAEWESSLNRKRTAMSFSEGGFLPHFMETLQYWYDHGIRMFKFDFADFRAATPATEERLSREEIRQRNITALREALRAFRSRNPGVVLVAFNGFGGDMESTASPFPFRDPVDVRWLEVFDALYSGDPRPSDVPQMNFWRSVDIYSDHMVRRYEQSCIPLERIDSTAFMVGNTGTIYYRKTNAWKGMAILTLARGGWVNTIHGNLEFLDDEKARWLAKVQSIYLRLQAIGRTKTFGGIAGKMQPYGFGSINSEGAIYTVVNPAQSVQEIHMPRLTRTQPGNGNGRLLFRDAGFVPMLLGDTIKLGPGQMAVVGYGLFARPEYDLGTQEDVRIPRAITPIPAAFADPATNTVETTIAVPARGDLRIVIQQHALDGSVKRSWGGGPPNGTNVAKIFTLTATQNGHPVRIEINYDKVIWSGLSWAVGEIRRNALDATLPITIHCSSADKDRVILQGNLYAVEY